jgi:hypothetical protein
VAYGVVIFVSFIPLTTDRFGAIDGGWCYIRKPESHKWTLTFWYMVSFFFWLYAAIIYYLFVFAYVYHKLYRYSESSTLSRSVRSAVFKIIWYPIILLITYGTLTIYLFWVEIDPDTNLSILGYISLALSTTQGLWDCVAFVISTTEVRKYLTTNYHYVSGRLFSAEFSRHLHFSGKSIEGVGPGISFSSDDQSSSEQNRSTLLTTSSPFGREVENSRSGDPV